MEKNLDYSEASVGGASWDRRPLRRTPCRLLRNVLNQITFFIGNAVGADLKRPPQLPFAMLSSVFAHAPGFYGKLLRKRAAKPVAQ